MLSINVIFSEIAANPILMGVVLGLYILGITVISNGIPTNNVFGELAPTSNVGGKTPIIHYRGVSFQLHFIGK